MGVSEPQRIERLPRSRPVLEGVKGRMDELIEEWEGRTTSKPESTEGGRRVSVLKRQEGAPVNLGYWL